jgi:hypothetical protein
MYPPRAACEGDGVVYHLEAAKAALKHGMDGGPDLFLYLSFF